MAQSKHADWILLGAHNPLFFDGPLDGVVRDVLHGSHTGVCVLVSTGDEGWEHQRIQRVVVGMFHNEDLAVDTIARQLATSLSVEVCTNTPERAAALRDVPNLRCSTLLGNDPLLAFVEHVQDSDADLVILPYLSEWRLRRGSAGERGRTLFQRLNRPIMIVHQPRIDHDGDQEPR